MKSKSIEAIYRYPVKGLSPESLGEARLTAGEILPFDRTYALEKKPGEFDASAPRHFRKTHFLVLMRYEKLAALETHFAPETAYLSIRQEGREVVGGDLSCSQGRQCIEEFFSDFMGDLLPDRPRIVHAPDHAFTDIPYKYLSVVNLASVRQLEKKMGQAINPLRFRANLYIDTGTPWEERGWQDKMLMLGDYASIAYRAPTTRCAAINVDPETARRDSNLLLSLKNYFDHVEMGFYAEVSAGGMIKQGDTFKAECLSNLEGQE